MQAAANGDSFSRKETLDLIQAYYQLDERPRRHLLDLAKFAKGRLRMNFEWTYVDELVRRFLVRFPEYQLLVAPN